MGRLLAQKLSEALGHNFCIDNLGGAGGNIGVANAASPRPDGDTLLMTSSSFVVNPNLHKKVPYDPYKGFTPVTIGAASPNILVVNPSDRAEHPEPPGLRVPFREQSSRLHRQRSWTRVCDAPEQKAPRGHLNHGFNDVDTRFA